MKTPVIMYALAKSDLRSDSPSSVAKAIPEQYVKEFHEFYPIYYDFKLAHLDGVAYQDLVDIITKKVSGHLSVDVREFDS